MLISAGIGVTPLLAMLASFAEQRSQRAVWWIHGARNGAEHPFRSEAQGHVAWLPGARAMCATAGRLRATSSGATTTPPGG